MILTPLSIENSYLLIFSNFFLPLQICDFEHFFACVRTVEKSSSIQEACTKHIEGRHVNLNLAFFVFVFCFFFLSGGVLAGLTEKKGVARTLFVFFLIFHMKMTNFPLKSGANPLHPSGFATDLYCCLH